MDDPLKRSGANKEELQFAKSEAQNTRPENTAASAEPASSNQFLSPRSPMEDYSNTKKLLAMSTDDEKTQHLKYRFDEILKLVKMPTETASKDNTQSIYQWVVPKHILSFLKNVLNENITFKLMSWNEFKVHLYDIYDHRLSF